MKEKNGEHPFGDTGQVILLTLFVSVWIVDSFFLRKSTFLSQWAPLPLRLSITAIAAAIAICLIKSGHAAVGNAKRGGGVLEDKAFRFVRHPLYLGSIVSSLAMAISTVSLFSLLVWAVMFAFYDFIAGYEEKLLGNRFGKAYSQYKARTGKWIPRLRKRDSACFARKGSPPS